MASNKKCGRCALRQPQSGLCPIFKATMSESEQGCPMFQASVIQCSVCGNPIIPGKSTIFEADSSGVYHAICNECAIALGTCAGCENAKSCAFENDPRPDKIIMETVRQGNAILQKQVQNPEIVRDTCAKRCKCFSEEFGCLRKINCCGNHNTVLEDYLIK